MVLNSVLNSVLSFRILSAQGVTGRLFSLLIVAWCSDFVRLADGETG